MQTIDDYGTFKDALAKAGAHARELACELRKLVAAVMPDVGKMVSGENGVRKMVSVHLLELGPPENE